jgi:hypothetical protein
MKKSIAESNHWQSLLDTGPFHLLIKSKEYFRKRQYKKSREEYGIISKSLPELLFRFGNIIPLAPLKNANTNQVHYLCLAGQCTCQPTACRESGGKRKGS